MQAQEEIQAQKDELSGQQLKKEQEYQQMLAETEGRYVDVLCNLIHKLSECDFDRQKRCYFTFDSQWNCGYGTGKTLYYPCSIG